MALYKNLEGQDLLSPHLIPLKEATEESFAPFGRLVHDFDAEQVWITTWPQKSWRKVVPGTGADGGITSGRFTCGWVGDLAMAHSESVHREYALGRLAPGVSTDNRKYLFTRIATYHPDGGQVFYPLESKAFVIILGPPGDDIKPEDFVAFYFDGTCGLQIKPDVWHQGLISESDSATFLTKQGKVHATVIVDTVDEFEKFLMVPLKPELSVD